MDPVVPYVILIAAAVAWHYYSYKQSGGRTHRPLWMAFSATALSIVFLAAGSMGYMLSRHDQFVAHTAWADGVLWSEVGAGLALALLAAILWPLGLRDLRTHQPRRFTRS